MQQQPISGSRPRPLRTTARGAILFQRDNGSAVELVRFSLGSFELDTKSMAALFGAKLARLVIDTFYLGLILSYEVIINRIDIKGGTLDLK